MAWYTPMEERTIGEASGIDFQQLARTTMQDQLNGISGFDPSHYNTDDKLEEAVSNAVKAAAELTNGNDNFVRPEDTITVRWHKSE